MSSDFEQLPWDAPQHPEPERAVAAAPTAALESIPAPPQPNLPALTPTVKSKRFFGLLIGGLFLAFMTVIWIGAFQSVGELQGIDALEEGDCVGEFFPDTEYVSSVIRTAPCEEPHAYEVFKVTTFWDIDEGAMFPGVETLEAEAQDWCTTAGADLLDQGNGPELAIWTFVPTEASWARGERDITCLAGDWDEEQLLTGRLVRTVGS